MAKNEQEPTFVTRNNTVNEELTELHKIVNGDTATEADVVRATLRTLFAKSQDGGSPDHLLQAYGHALTSADHPQARQVRNAISLASGASARALEQITSPNSPDVNGAAQPTLPRSRRLPGLPARRITS